MTATGIREFSPAYVRSAGRIEATATRQTRPPLRPARRARWSGLDGLRALAVLAVVIFHFAPGVLPGGFLGVDVFFVISGYVITRLLTAEYVRRGRLGLRDFYLRRARRLLPGLGVLLVVVLAASTVWRDQLATVRPATAAAAGYVSNWWLVFAHESYFVSVGRPSMLQHLWSLAVEEQFYLVWPLVTLLVLRARDGARHPGRAVRRLAVVAGVLALLSTGLLTLLAVMSDVPYASDGSRLYYGTDTHSMGLLLGSAAGALAADRLRPSPRRIRLLWASDLAAGVALTAVVTLFVVVGQDSRWLYRGGFLAVAALACVVVSTAARRGSLVGRALDVRPLRWVGARSYSIYLWHWPVAVVTRPGHDIPLPAVWVDLLRVMLTTALAELSYRGIERPVRTLGFRRAWARGRRRLADLVIGRVPVGARLAGVGSLALIVLASVVLLTGPSAPISAAQRSLGGVTGVRDMELGAPQRAAQQSRVTPSSAVAPSSPTGSSTTATRPAPRPVDRSVSAYGDSVMLGARLVLARSFPGGSLDAVEGRQPGPILADIRHDAAHHRLHPTVIIGVGDNGLIAPGDLRRTLVVLAQHHVRRVIVIDNRVGRPWEGPNNRLIAAETRGFASVRLLHWHARSARHPSWFYDDGIHLTPAGQRAYARMLVALWR